MCAWSHIHATAVSCICCFFFFNDTATTEIYTLSLHDALPIWIGNQCSDSCSDGIPTSARDLDRKSTRLNSSHGYISYAVFCLKKKKKHEKYAHHRHHHMYAQSDNRLSRLS